MRCTTSNAVLTSFRRVNNSVTQLTLSNAPFVRK